VDKIFFDDLKLPRICKGIIFLIAKAGMLCFQICEKKNLAGFALKWLTRDQTFQKRLYDHLPMVKIMRTETSNKFAVSQFAD
jgi:hypothetical protein